MEPIQLAYPTMVQADGPTTRSSLLLSVWAASRDEALGKAHRFCHLRMPERLGWTGHQVRVLDPDAEPYDVDRDTIEPLRPR